MAEQQASSSGSKAEAVEEAARRQQGPVMPIGGAEDTEPGGEILERFLELAGGNKARIAVIPTASQEPQRSGEGYVKLFCDMGAAKAEWIRIEERGDALGGTAVKLIENATGIFITGGDQARLVELLAGTHVMEAIRNAHAQGVVVAGTSAGASIVGAHMMVPGNGTTGDTAARKGMVDMVAGFGLLQDVIVDQHFSERGRIGRLLTIFAANPGMLAVGLDEDTAVIIDGDGLLETLGSGMVTLLDGRTTVSDYYSRKDGEILSVTGSSLTVLGPGRHFDLIERVAIDVNPEASGVDPDKAPGATAGTSA
jgi:cyanophycinase